jgi:hypothetical protein
MFWAAFGHGIHTSLIIIEGDPDAPKGGVTAQVYLGVLETHLETILNPGDIFMQDGAGIHHAGIIKAFFRDMDIALIKWPPYNPDLNPIKNL